MSKYGYNPDEHFQTKVTLIDKDGFHKESDEISGGLNNVIKVNTLLAERISFYIANSEHGAPAYKCLTVCELPDEQMYSSVNYIYMEHIFICRSDEATMTDEEVLLEMSNYDDIPSEPFISLHPSDGAHVYSMYGFALGAHTSTWQFDQQDTDTIIFNKLEAIEKGTPITVYVGFISEKDNELYLKKFNTIWKPLDKDDERIDENK